MTRPHRRDYIGLWVSCLFTGIAQVILGGLFIFTNGSTTSPTFDPVRGVMVAMGVPRSDAMIVWGLVMWGLAACVLVTALIRRLTLLHLGIAMAIDAAIWVMLATVFFVYATQHRGLGMIGAVLWALGGGWCFSAGLTATGYYNDPRPRK